MPRDRLKVYHVTYEDASVCILQSGFIGTVGLADRPIHECGLHRGDVVLGMEIPALVFETYTYHARWMVRMARIPASLVNLYGKPEVIDFSINWVDQQLRKLGY